MSFLSRSKILGQNAGFTLLEVLISIFLLVVISMAIYQATTETYRVREVISNEGDFHNGIRLALGMMDRDVALAYSPAAMVTTPNSPNTPADAQDMRAIMGDAGQETTFWGPALDKSGIRPSRFIGTESKITLISASNFRVYRESRESDFIKVVYELQPDRAPGAAPDSRSLVRLVNTNAFGVEDGALEKDEFSRVYPLLHGVKSMKLRYYHREKDQWYPSWKTGLGTTNEQNQTFPDAVEVSIEVSGQPRLRFSGKYVMRPEIPHEGLNPSF